jgi:uncharacterized membrane protein
VIGVALQTVHTTGINWQSVAVIVGSLGVFILSAMIWFVALIDRRNRTIRTEISSAVDNLAAVLTARLETKDAVNQLRVEVAQLKGQIEREGMNK